MGLDDAYVAYCLDEAVHDLAAYIEEELDAVKVKGDKPDILQKRKQAKLEALLTGNIAKQFADPMSRV